MPSSDTGARGLGQPFVRISKDLSSSSTPWRPTGDDEF
jgi:hypothetical protein